MPRILVAGLLAIAVVAARHTSAQTTEALPEVQWADPNEPDLRDTAAALGSPTAIYEFVRNEFRYVPYHGSRSNSINTFLGHEGNDVDLASLLIAMLRSRGISARYATGVIQADATQITRWLRVNNVDLAARVLNDQGIQSVSIGTGGTTISFEHIWVQAQISLDDYRGAGTAAAVNCVVEPTKCTWVDLDPSFKEMTYVPGPVDVYTTVTFGYDDYYFALRSGRTPVTAPDVRREGKTPTEIYGEQILSYFRANSMANTLEDVAGVHTVLKDESGLIPTSLPFAIVSAPQTFISITERDAGSTRKWRKQLRAKIFWRRASPGVTEISFDVGAFALADLSTKRLTISYEIGSQSRMVVRLSGIEVAAPLVVGMLIIAGQTVDVGFPFDLDLSMDDRPGTTTGAPDDSIERTHSALTVGGMFEVATGGYASNWSQVHRAERELIAANRQYRIVNQPVTQQPYVDADGNGVVDTGEIRLLDDQLALDALTGGLLHSASTLYFARLRDAVERISELDHAITLIGGFVGLFSTSYGVDYVDGTPFSVRPKGLIIDMTGIRYHGSWRTNAAYVVSNKTSELIGTTGSALEHEVWEQLTGHAAISTMSGIQQVLANASNQLLKPRNVAGIETMSSSYDGLGFSTSMPADILTDPNYLYDMFGHRYRGWHRPSGVGYVDALRRVVDPNTPAEQLPEVRVTVGPNNAGTIDDLMYYWNYNEDWVLHGNTFLYVCGHGPLTTQEQMLAEIRSCFYENVDSAFPTIGDQYLAHFDEANGFTVSGDVYRRHPRSNLSQYYTAFVTRRRNDVLLSDGIGWTDLVLPSVTVEGAGYRFNVWVDKRLDAETLNIVEADYIIQNDYFAAGGGWVSGTQPLTQADPTAFNNQQLTDKSLNSIANNNPVTTPSTTDPISTVTGNMFHDETDLRIRGRGLDYIFTRTYNSGPTAANLLGLPMGHRWSHSYGMRLIANTFTQQPNAADPDPSVVSSITYVDERGGEALFGVTGTGAINTWPTPTPPRGRFETLDLSQGASQIYTIRFRNEVEYVFGDANLATVGAVARLKSIREPNGAQLNFGYDAAGNLISITDNLGIAGRTGLVLEYFPDRRLKKLSDWTGRSWNYAYDTSGNLQSVTNPLSQTVTYEYATPATHGLTAVVLPEDRNGAAAGGQVRRSFDYYRNGKAFRNFDSFGNGETVDYDLYRRRTSITDPRDFIRSHICDRDGQLTKLEEPDGGVLLFSHTAADGLRFLKRDALGYTTLYSYNTNRTTANCELAATANCQANAGGNITLEKDPIAGQMQYTYGIMDQVTVTTDKRGNVITRTYYTTNDPNSGVRRGRLQRIDATLEGTANRPLEEFTWNADGTVRQQTEYIIPGNTTRKRLTAYTYQPGTNDLNVSEINTTGSGRTLRRTFTYDALGRIVTETLYRRRSYDDATQMSLTTTYEYDALDRVTAVVDPSPFSNRHETEFDANSRIRQVRDLWKKPDTTFETRNVSTRLYDQADRVIEESDVLGKSTHYEYDEAGNVIAVTDANGNVSRLEYDSMGRMTAAIDANGHRAETVYDLAGRALRTIDANGNAVTYTYDPLGRPLAVTNALGFRSTRVYDANGNVVDETNANADLDATQRNSWGSTIHRTFDEFNRTRLVYDASHGATSSITTYTYDLLGNILTVTDAEGGVTMMTYDDIGDLTRVADPVVEAGTDKVSTFEYDEARNRIRSIDRKSQETRYTFDELNRLRIVDLRADTTLNETYTYDYRADLTEVRNSAVTYTFGYDQKHHLLSKEDRRGTLARTLSWTYDAADNVATKTNYAGELTEYQYDSTHRLVGLRNRDYLSVSYQYDPAGRLLNRILSNGSQTDYAYDAANRLRSLINRSPTGVLESNVYGRDRVGNITSLDESVLVGAATFGYDRLHRLRMADYPGTVNDRCYTYDRVGNRKRETQGNVTNCLTGTAPTPTYNYVHDADNRLTDQRQGTGATQVAHFDYDFNGNLITRWSTPSVLVETLTYDPKNRLKSLVRGALQPTFRYDPFDYRTEKTIAAGNARHYYLEGEHLEMVTDVNNAVLGKYLRGVVIDEIVSGYQRPLATDAYSVWSWQHDAVGSVTQLVRHEGTSELAQRYLPFGEKTISQPPTNFFGYTGREQDENGTYYYRARYYDPALGRFLSEDPIGLRGGINFYAYVGNNPLLSNDPTGKLSSFQHIGITYGAARDAGWGVWRSIGLGLQVAWVDVSTQGTRARQANQHGMSGYDFDGMQSPDVAISSTVDYIRDPDIYTIAQALHAGQDLAAPWHAGVPWSGYFKGPGTVWDNVVDTVSHLFHDAFPGDAVKGDASAISASILADRQHFQFPKPVSQAQDGTSSGVARYPGGASPEQFGPYAK